MDVNSNIIPSSSFPVSQKIFVGVTKSEGVKTRVGLSGLVVSGWNILSGSDRNLNGRVRVSNKADCYPWTASYFFALSPAGIFFRLHRQQNVRDILENFKVFHPCWRLGTVDFFERWMNAANEEWLAQWIILCE